VSTRLLVLGFAALIACAGPGRAQTKMPVPVEDDPTAPAAIKEPIPKTAPEPPPPADSDSTPYHQALIAYHAEHYQEAYDALKGSDPGKQDDAFVILEARVLTELKKYDEGEKLLRPRLGGPAAFQVDVALGDLLLRKRSYERATKYFTSALQAKPSDPDLTLKLVYARIGAGDLQAATHLASQLTPFDPKNPYDDHASYYFAHAALAQATGRPAEADENIQSARTNYGNSVTNRYLRNYLLFIAPPDKDAPSDLTPTPKAK
jgi:tetratricopeptide (TPR) repeat protein